MWLHINERTVVLASLTCCLRCLSAVSDDPAEWQWAILSMHSTLQSAMACHLTGTADVGALTQEVIEAMLEWHERDRRGEIERINLGKDKMGILHTKIVKKEDYPPSKRLAGPKELFKRLYNPHKRAETAGDILEISNSQRDSFRRLNEFRHDFTHFTPKGWSIELSGLPDIFLDMLDVLDKISADPWPFRHMEEKEKDQLKKLLEELRVVLVRLSQQMLTSGGQR